jgi:hypothetical protein
MRDLVTCWCAYCGAMFEATRYDAKYCPGGKCRRAAAKARKKHQPGATESAQWLDKVDAETREKFYFVRTNSDVAANLISALAATYGPDAAKLATHAADHAIFGTMAPKRAAWEVELDRTRQ